MICFDTDVDVWILKGLRSQILYVRNLKELRLGPGAATEGNRKWKMEMGRHREEIHAALAGRITIWGGIPATQLCPGSTDEVSFRR